MKLIFKCKFGSHLYGTDTEKSDLDFKGVFIPDADDLIMQRASKTFNTSTKKGSETKNSSDDVDTELVSVQQFIKLLLEGQTMALDMLFCSPKLVLFETPEWHVIRDMSKKHLLHSGTSAFVGYTKQQAAKYGVKGFRVSALRQILEWLKGYKDYTKLEFLVEHCELPKNENINIVEIQGPVGPEKHLEVCNRKVPLKATLKYAIDVYQRVFDLYGERALKAERNEGIDWKALSHAVRVAGEAKELLEKGVITFPRPDRELLLAIKKGEMPYKEVEKIIERGLLEVEEAQKNSILPKEPDFAIAEVIVKTTHLNRIVEFMYET